MSFTNKLIDLIGILMTLMVLTLPSTAANIDCNGKPFHCVNSTHFMICVDLGSGVSSTIDDFVLQCPPPTVCQESNKFECDFPVVTSTPGAPTVASTVTSVSEIETVTKPYDFTTSVTYEQYLDTPTTTTLSDDVLITHQTTVTESTIQLVTDVTTFLPHSLSSNITGTTPDALRNVNVTIPDTKFNSTEEIFSTDVAPNDLRTTPTLANNISGSNLDVSSAKTEEVNIVTHESIINSTLNKNIQGATKNATYEKILYTSNNTDLSFDITKTSPSFDGIQNDVTNPLPLNINANITGLINNTTENTTVTISASEINLTITETAPSAPEDIVTAYLSNSESNITNLIKDSIKNVTLATIAQNLNETIPSETNVTQYEHTLQSPTEPIIYHVTETFSTTEKNTTELISTNSSATNILLDGTEKVPNTFNQTTPKVDVAQPESSINNMSDYVKNLIHNATETILDVTIQSVTEIAQTESTLLSNLNSDIIINNGSDTITESILSKVTELTFNDIYLHSAFLPIHTIDTTTESMLGRVSETTPKVELRSASTTLLPNEASVSTRDPGLIVSELNLDSSLNKTTPIFQTDTVQNKHALISNSSSSVLPNYVAETATEVTKVTEINPSAPASKTILSANVLQKDYTTTLSYLIVDTADVTVKVAESAMNYTANASTSSLNISQNDYTTPLPSISADMTNTTKIERDISNNNSDFNRITQNETNIASNDHALLLNVSGSTVLPEETVTETESILIIENQTPGNKQNNRTTQLSEFTTVNPTELIPSLTENDNVLILGLETNVSETIISVNSVRKNTLYLPLDSNTVQRNVTLNDTLPSLAGIATESILLKVVETTPSSFNIVQDYLTSYASNTTLPDKLVDIVTELPVTNVTKDINIVRAGNNLTFQKVENKNNVPNDIKKIDAQYITDLSMKKAPNHTDNDLILSVHEINKENSTTEVSMIPSFNEPVMESYNGSSTTSLVNDSKNETSFVITTTDDTPLEINSISFRKNMNNASQAGTINYESNTIYNENILTTALPYHLAESTFSQNPETSTQQIEIKTDSYVESKILKSDKTTNILIATQSTLSSLSVDNVQSEVTLGPTINPRTTTSAFVLTNSDKNTSVNTVERETSDITASEYVNSTFQTEPLIVKTTVVADMPPNDTELLGRASITNQTATKSVRTSVTESYSTTNYIANVNADTKKLLERSSSAGNIDVESKKQTNTMLHFNSSSEQLLNGGQPTTATLALSKSTPTQDNVNLTPTNVLFHLPSALEHDNLAVSVQQESYKEPINSNVNQIASPNEIPTIKDITIHNTNTLKDTFTTSVNTSTAVRKDLPQEINNTKRHMLGITSQNKQDQVLEKSNLPIGGQNLPSQNKDTITDRQRTILLDILLSTPQQLLLTTQSTPPQANYTAQYYATASTLTIDNLHAQQNFNDDFNNAVPVKVATATQIDVIDKPYFKSNRSKGSILEERLDLKRGSENKTISSLTLNESKSSQPIEEKPQTSNDSLTSIASSVNLDQDNVTSKQNTADNLTIRPSTEAWQEKVFTGPNMDKAVVTSKQYIADNLTIRPSTEAWRATVVTEPYIDKAVVTSKQYIADNLTTRPSTEAWRVKVVTEPTMDKAVVTSKLYIADNLTTMPSTTAWRAKVVTEPNMDKAVVTSKQYIADNLTTRPSTEAWRATVVTEPNMDKAVVTSKQYIADNLTTRPSTEAWRATVVTEPNMDKAVVTSKQYIADNLTTRPSTEAWRATVVTEPTMDKAVVTSKQYIADNLTTRPSTKVWQATVVTSHHIGEDTSPSLDTSKKYIADKLTIRPSTEAWRATVVTELPTGEDEVTLKLYSADTSTLNPSMESLQAIVVTKPYIDQNKVISSQNSGDTPMIKIEPTETRGKLSVISDKIKSVSKPNEDKTILKQRVTSTSEDERLLIDLKSITDTYQESLIKDSQNDAGIAQTAYKSNLDNLQSNHESTSKMEFINNPKNDIAQTTDQVITKTSDLNLDKGNVMIQAVKTNNEWLIKNSSPIGNSPPLKMKGDRKLEEIESVEQSEINEEQAEYEESMKEEHLEALENKEELKKMSPKIHKISPVYEYVNFKNRLETTIEMTTKKVEDKSNSHQKFITNIEVQPAIVTETFETTKVARNITTNVNNSKINNTLSKSYVNTHTASTPVFVSAKRNFVCKINSRGKFPDKNDCRKFYVCSGKLEPIEGLCPNNTVFSELRKQCTKNISHCIRNNQFQCVREGRFSDYFNDNIYYICLKNNVSTFTRFKLQCLSGYHLNKTSVRCALNTEWSRSTSQQSISDVSINSERVPSSRNEKLVVESSNKFECNKEGKFPDPNNCRKYYVCSKKNGKSRYRLKRKKCDSDELFHKDKKKCVDADSYDCN